MNEIKGIIQINQNIQVALLDDQENWYISSIQDLTDYELRISIPTKGTTPLVLKNGDFLKISFVTESSRYEFETRVIGWRYDNIPMYALTLPKDFKRVQLRKFVRIPTVLEVLYAEVPDEGKHFDFFKTTSLDLSGGGVRLLLNKDLPVGARLLLKITIPLKSGPECLEIIGKVVRSRLDENLKLYHTAIQFTEIGRSQQDLIVRYIFTKMSEQRRLS